MKTEMSEVTRKRVSEALLLIGVGTVWALDLWWPGILVAFGVAQSSSFFIRRRYWAAAVVAILLCVLPAAYTIAPSWGFVLPVAVIGVGGAGLVRAFSLRNPRN